MFFYHKCSIMFQPENSFVCRKAMEREVTFSWPLVTRQRMLADLWLNPLSFAPLHSRSLKQRSKDGWHLVEATGSPRWPIPHCIFNRGRVENLQTSDFPLPGWILSQVFACHMSSVIFTDIIQTVLQISECFLSITNTNVHILAFGTE